MPDYEPRVYIEVNGMPAGNMLSVEPNVEDIGRLVSVELVYNNNGKPKITDQEGNDRSYLFDYVSISNITETSFVVNATAMEDLQEFTEYFFHVKLTYYALQPVDLSFAINKSVQHNKYLCKVFGYSQSLGITYTIVGKDYNYKFHNTPSVGNNQNTHTFTSNDDLLRNLRIYIPNGTKLTNVVLKPMLVEGDTAPTEFKEGFNGLKHAYFKGVRSTGRQLLNPAKIVDGYYLQQDSAVLVTDKPFAYYAEYLPIIQGKSYYAYFGNMYNTGVFGLFAYDKDKNFLRQYFPNPGESNLIYTPKNDEVFVRFNFKKITKGEAFFMFAEGDRVYEEYKEDNSFAYTEAQQLKEYDYLLPQEGKKGEQTKVVAFDGTEKFFLVHISNSDGTDFVFALDISATPQDTASHENVISNNYSTAKGTTRFFMSNNTIVQGGTNEPNYIYIRDDRFTTVDEWKTHLAELATAGNPLTVAYKTATATETDLKPENESYLAYLNGQEIVDEGEIDNGQYGAVSTITQEYFELAGGNE